LFTKTDVIDSFETLIRERTPLPQGLVELWFEQALGQYELEIGDVGYNREAGAFSETVNRAVITTLGYMMKVMYVERELSRVNKINNIITNDIKLNGNGETKKYTYNELLEERAAAADYINNRRPHGSGIEVVGWHRTGI
jgi:hypothetical protein